MPLTITDFIEQVDGVSTEDIPFDERERINDKLADLTGGPGGTGAPVNNDAILVSKNLDGRNGFDTIQSAVDNASTGNTIFVEPGEYTESVTIHVDGLTLKAADGASPTIDAGGGSRTRNTGIVGIEATDVRVEGFTIRNFAEIGITIFPSASGAEVVDNTVDTSSANQETSFAINTDSGGADNLLIKNNELGYGLTGSLSLNQNSEVTVEGNTISDTLGTADQEIGIVEAGGSNITIIENTISGANARGIRAGAAIPGVTANTDNLSISSNDISDNYGGIVIDADKVDYSLDNNTFSGNEVDIAEI